MTNNTDAPEKPLYRDTPAPGYEKVEVTQYVFTTEVRKLPANIEVRDIDGHIWIKIHIKYAPLTDRLWYRLRFVRIKFQLAFYRSLEWFFDLKFWHVMESWAEGQMTAELRMRELEKQFKFKRPRKED